MTQLFVLMISVFVITSSNGMDGGTNPPTGKNGLYKSTTNSFRNNFYVQIAGDSVTLYGWEIGLNKDTVYYRTNTVNDADTGKVNWKFENYEFSSTPITSDNIGGFTADTSINFLTGSLHTFFMGEYYEGMFELIAFKATLDSRLDVFEFVKIK